MILAIAIRRPILGGPVIRRSFRAQALDVVTVDHSNRG